MKTPAALEVLQIPFSRAVAWYGDRAVPPPALRPFPPPPRPEGGVLLGCLQTRPSATRAPPSASSCVLYLHGFPDQSVDHCGGGSGGEGGEGASYGQFSSRMARKLAESCDAFCAFNFAGSPGSASRDAAFYDKTVTQEVWDVLNAMSYLRREKSVGGGGFHLVGLSTGAIVGALARGVSDDVRRRLDLPPILSISIVASCGATDLRTALEFDFDRQQQDDFDTLGYCWKQFWLPRNEPDNPDGAVLVDAGSEESEGGEGRWVPHVLKLGRRYRDDFLQLPVRRHVAGNADAPGGIPLLVIHGRMDRSIPFEEGVAVYEAAAEPKKFVEIPKGNHLLTNSKDLKKAIRAIREWQSLYDVHSSQ